MTGCERRFAQRLGRRRPTACRPISTGSHSPKSLLNKLPSIQEEANQLKEAHKTGTPWSDIAVIYRDYGTGKPVLAALRKAGIPVTYQVDITFAEKEGTVKFLITPSCKGLDFPLEAIPGVIWLWMKGGRMRRRGCCMWR